ncbi:MAG: methyltransferase domain-containing protein [Xanthomonadales bacterium]|nr:methyltransferase domain-containing protein [Xanthomonadales bacterium]
MPAIDPFLPLLRPESARNLETLEERLLLDRLGSIRVGDWVDIGAFPVPAEQSHAHLRFALGADGRIHGPARFAPTAWPWPEGSLHGIVLQHVLEFVVEPGALLAEARRVLRPGGRLWLSTFNPHSPVRFRRDLVPPGQPLRWHSVARLRSQLRAAEFADIHIERCALGWPWRCVPDRVLRLGSLLLVSARRPANGAQPVRLQLALSNPARPAAGVVVSRKPWARRPLPAETEAGE